MATVGACFVSTPMEVLKTRLQLQGELEKSGFPKKYNGLLHGAYTIWRHEGLIGIYSGIAPALWYQIVMNGSRFGIHSFFKDFFGVGKRSKTQSYFLNLLSSGLAGMMAAFMASPFYLIKVRLQSSTKNFLAVGHQHNYAGMMAGLKDIFQKEGILGLWRGADGQMIRVGVGSAVQLSTYEQVKSFIESTNVIQSPFIPCVSAMITSVPLVLVMNPLDTMSTRLYNQPVENGIGLLYSGPINCLFKTFREEGVYGWYKGTVPHYFRVAPHTIVTFILFEKFKSITRSIGS